MNSSNVCPAPVVASPLFIASVEAGPSPAVSAERYQELTSLIEQRLFDYAKDFEPSQTVRQWLSGIYADQDLTEWDRERRELQAFLPLG